MTINIDYSRRGRARADAQGRCDGVGSEEIGSASRVLKWARESLFRKKKNLHFFGDVPARRPWAIHTRRAVDENGNRILLVVPIFGGKKQYVAITKTSPLACRSSVTFPEAREPEARKIAESVKPVK